MTLRVQEYVREDGSVPYKIWFDRLDSHAAVKVATAVTRLSLGNTSNVKWFGGIGELKVNWGQARKKAAGRRVSPETHKKR